MNQASAENMTGIDTNDLAARLDVVERPGRRKQCRVLVLSTPFPSRALPMRGIFVKERIKAVAALPGVEVQVVSPTAWFPPLKVFRKWYHSSQYPRKEIDGTVQVSWPRYPFPPKVGGYLHPHLMYWSITRAVDKLREDFDFDLIDAHFVYPNGVLAAMLGRRYNRPVVMTGRGEDMLRFPQLPIIGSAIQKTVSQNHRFVALSREIADAFSACGADQKHISVIPNGVDIRRFSRTDQAEARDRLQLSKQGRIIVSVGDQQERKGFHILVDSLLQVRKHHPDTQLIIIGGAAPYGSDFGEVITKRIHDNGLSDCVRLVGRVAHDDLAMWYSAADLFALLSSREGSPNVLLEALACGTPAVATAIGGIPEELADPQLGVLVPERTADAAARALDEALSRNWDRVAICEKMQSRTWSATAERVHQVFLEAMEHHAWAGESLK